MNKFKLVSNFSPKGDQSQAIEKLTKGIKKGFQDQTLLGVTGSGKTFTMANIVRNVQKPTLVISHNKTLAAQLYSEFKEFFPENAVHYFVSYYDYYQPEAYVPRTDTYIEKDASINEEIDRLRHAATSSLLTRSDTLIVASVSCIYGIGSPEEYLSQAVHLSVNETKNRDRLLKLLTEIQYARNDIGFTRGRFRVRGDTVDIFPPYSEVGIRVEFFGNKIETIKEFDPLTGEILKKLSKISIFPAKHFVTPKEKLLLAVNQIKVDLEKQVAWFKRHGKELEAQRLLTRTNYDIEMMLETGYCSGIENYSLYLSNRKRGEPPFTLIHYFPDDFLLFIDESHMTVPQIGGMFEGDRSRKQTLVNFGFRLPTALDNRPLKFPEFEKLINQVIYVSATPAEYELQKSSKGQIKTSSEFFKKREKEVEVKGVVEQIIRPTGLVDPEIEVRPAKHQIDDLIDEISLRVKKKQRVLVTTLTKRMAEDLADFLSEAGVKVHYLHSEIATLERPEILRDLRLGKYDVVVGINLLREGLDLPEVSLVCILDADKEGFLRSDVSLIQTIGRAARHEKGKVIMYADTITGSMKRAIDETNRRRVAQIKYNKEHRITPQTIKKAIRESLKEKVEIKPGKEFEIEKIPKDEIGHLIKELKNQMDLAAKNLEFEKAAILRDRIREIDERLKGKKILGR